MISADVVLIIAGCVLVLIGLLGGGIQSGQISVGKINGVARVCCALVGFGFVGAGAYVKLSPSEPPKPSQVSAARTTVKFFLMDDVIKDQATDVVEQSSIDIDGQHVASFRVNDDDPLQFAQVELSVSGSHQYRVSGTRSWVDQHGNVNSQSGTGDGMIDIQDGEKIEVVFDAPSKAHLRRLTNITE